MYSQQILRVKNNISAGKSLTTKITDKKYKQAFEEYLKRVDAEKNKNKVECIICMDSVDRADCCTILCCRTESDVKYTCRECFRQYQLTNYKFDPTCSSEEWVKTFRSLGIYTYGKIITFEEYGIKCPHCRQCLCIET